MAQQLFRTVKTKADYEEFQEDPPKMGKWETMWQMKITVSKCKGAHGDKNSRLQEYANGA